MGAALTRHNRNAASLIPFRCVDCSGQAPKTCARCEQPMSDPMSATGSSVCRKCYESPRICSRCEQPMSLENFDRRHVFAYDAKKITFLVCKSCREQGYRCCNID